MEQPARRSPTILYNDPPIYRRLVAELGRPGAGPPAPNAHVARDADRSA